MPRLLGIPLPGVPLPRDFCGERPLPGDFAGDPLRGEWRGVPRAGELPGVWLHVDLAGDPIPNILAACSNSESLSKNLADRRGKVARFCPPGDCSGGVGVLPVFSVVVTGNVPSAVVFLAVCFVHAISCEGTTSSLVCVK